MLNSAESKFFRPSFWLFAPLLVCLGGGLYFWSEQKIEARGEYLLSLLHTQADSALWSVENAVSLFRIESPDKISLLLKQMAQQPGIAWLALVSREGEIIADSEPHLQGKKLYTPQEMLALKPEKGIQGRFSPDEPEVFEVWKSLPPRPGIPQDHAPVLFAAIDSSFLHKALKNYASELRWQIFFIILSVALGGVIFYLAWQFRKSGKKLEDAQAVALQVARNFPDGLLVADVTGKLVSFNNHFLRLLKKDRPRGNGLAALPGNWLALADKVATSQKQQTALMRLEDGRVLRVTANCIYSNGDRLAGFLFMVADESGEQSRREKEMEREKFASLGKVAAGIAHEIRNPLGAMCGYASFLAERLRNDESAKKVARLLLEEGERLNNVLSEMLALARKPELRPTPTRLSALFAKLLLLAQPDAAAKNIQVEIAYEPPGLQEAEVFVDKDKMLQVLLNILINAISFSPANSSIKITANSEIRENENFFAISIRDHGQGIAPELLEQIFTPYFTTRPEGAGVGLALAKNIVESHGGSIYAANADSGGALFKISLPGCANEKQ